MIFPGREADAGRYPGKLRCLNRLLVAAEA